MPVLRWGKQETKEMFFATVNNMMRMCRTRAEMYGLVAAR